MAREFLYHQSTECGLLLSVSQKCRNVHSAVKIVLVATIIQCFISGSYGLVYHLNFPIRQVMLSTSYQSKQPSLKSLQITNTRECVKKRESSYTIGGKVSWSTHRGKQYGSSTENRITVRSSNPIPGHKPGKNYNAKRYMHPCVYSITIHSSQVMETAYMSIPDKWVKKMWCIYTMVYCNLHIQWINCNGQEY